MVAVAEASWQCQSQLESLGLTPLGGHAMLRAGMM
jgi:hypothetical protein